MHVNKLVKLAKNTNAILKTPDGQTATLIGAGVVVVYYFIDKIIDNGYRIEISDKKIVVEPAS